VELRKAPGRKGPAPWSALIVESEDSNYSELSKD
jgi:hypothetical protein